MKHITHNIHQATNRGFTLIEVLVVMGIAAILAGMGLLFTLDFYRSYAFNSERDLVIGLLQKARARSMSNLNQTTYGVCINNGNYILFSGSYNISTSCNPSSPDNESFPVHPSVINTGIEISFEQLRGKANFNGGPGILTLSYGIGRTTSISINSEGQIEW